MATSGRDDQGYTAAVGTVKTTLLRVVELYRCGVGRLEEQPVINTNPYGRDMPPNSLTALLIIRYIYTVCGPTLYGSGVARDDSAVTAVVRNSPGMPGLFCQLTGLSSDEEQATLIAAVHCCTAAGQVK